MYKITLLALVMSFSTTTQAQVYSVNFTTADTLCSGNYTLENQTTGADSLFWDFCLGNFENAPTEIYTDPNFGSSFTGVSTANTFSLFTNGQYYSFITSGSAIGRLDFGSSMTNTPTFTNLGNPGSLLTFTRSEIELVAVGDGRYRGFIPHLPSNQLFIYDFDSITDPSPTTSLINFTNAQASSPTSVAIVQDPTGYQVLIGSNSSTFAKMTWLTFEDSILNPTPTIQTIPDPGGSFDIDYYQTADSIFLYAISRDNFSNIKRLAFANSIKATPDAQSVIGTLSQQSVHLNVFDYYGRPILVAGPRLATNQDAIEVIGLDSNSPGGFITSIYTGYLATNGVSLIRSTDGQIYSTAVNRETNQLSVLAFTDLCNNGLTVGSTDSLPTLNLPQADTIPIGLWAQNVQGVQHSLRKDLIVSEPVVADFSVGCGVSTIDFTNQSSTFPTETTASYTWDFGDTSPSVVADSPTHTYTPPGPFVVTLIAQSTTGCADTSSQTINLSEPPTADFQSSLVCGNDSIHLNALTTPGTGNVVVERWIVAGDTILNPGTTWSYWPDTAGLYAIRLVVEDDLGCFDDSLKTVNVRKSALLAQAACANGEINFVPTFDYNTDAIQQNTLLFGNGDSTTVITSGQAIAYLYDTAATLTAELITSSAAGCQDTAEFTFATRRLNFEQDPANDSCTGSAQTFIAAQNFKNYKWDASIGELNQTPTLVYQDNGLATMMPGADRYDNCTIIDSAGRFVGFVTNSQFAANVDFGNDITQPPTFTQISTLSFTNNLSELELAWDSLHSKWVGFSIQRSGTLFRAVFDSLLDPSPVVTAFNISSGLSDYRTVKAYVSPSQTRYLLIGAWSGNSEIVRLRLGNSWQNPPVQSAPIQTDSRSVQAIEIINRCDSVFLACIPQSLSDLYVVSFADSISATPDSVQDVYSFPGTRTQLVSYTQFDQDYLLASHSSGFSVLEFSNGYAQPPSVAQAFTNNRWAAIAPIWVNGNLYSASCDRDVGTFYLHQFPNPIKTLPGGASGDTFIVEFVSNQTIELKLQAEDNARLLVEAKTISPLYGPRPVLAFNQATVCAQDSITVVAQDTNSVLSGTTFDWLVGSFNLSGDTVGAVLPFDLNTPLTLTATAANGCSATIDTTLEVRERPKAGFDVISAACATGAVTFEDTSVYTSGSLTLSTWDMGIDEQTLVNPVTSFDYEFLNPGAKVVTLAVLGDNGCADTLIQTLPLPSADFALSQSCTGVNTSVLPNINYPGDNVTSYDWTLPGGLSSSQPTPPSFTPPTGLASVQLILNTQSGCEDTISRAFNFAQPPNVQIGLPDALCVGEQLTFVDNSSASVPTESRHWRFSPPGDEFSAIGSALPYSFLSAGSYDVQLRVTLEGGCQDSNTISVNISPRPAIELSDTFLGCNEQLLFVQLDSLANTDLVHTYLWSYVTDSGLFFSELATPAFVSDSAIERRVQLQVTNAAGCVASDSTLLIFRPSPSVSFSATPTTGNVPIAVQFSPTASDFDSLLWQFSPTDSLVSTQDTAQRFAFIEAGPRVVELIAYHSSGCTDTARATFNFSPEIIGSLDVILQELLPEFNTDNGQLSIGALVQNNSNIALEELRYELHVGEVSVTDSFSFTTITPGGFATLRLPPTFGINPYIQPAGICLSFSAPNGFADTDTTNNRLCTTLGNGLRVDAVYPSPFREALMIRAYTEGETLEVVLIDVLGKVVGQWQFTNPTGTHEHTLDLLNRADGVYYLRLRSGQSEQVRAVVKR